MAEFPKPVTKKNTQKILNQMDNSIYSINGIEWKNGFCFFCNIKLKQEKIPVMIVNYKIINEKYLANNNSIDILIKNEFETIEFGNVKYMNKQYDITIIDIKIDENSKINLLDIDEFLYKDKSEMCYDMKSIYNKIYHQSLIYKN